MKIIFDLIQYICSSCISQLAASVKQTRGLIKGDACTGSQSTPIIVWNERRDANWKVNRENKTKCNFKILVFRCFFARASFCQTNVTWQENLCKALHVLPGQIAQQILVGRHKNKSSWISLSNIFGDLIILQMWEREQPAPCRSSCSFFPGNLAGN